MDWIITLSALGFGLVLLGLSLWQTSRPRRDSLRARWAPWRFLILVAGAVIVLATLHLLTLTGVKPVVEGAYP